MAVSSNALVVALHWGGMPLGGHGVALHWDGMGWHAIGMVCSMQELGILHTGGIQHDMY